MCACVRAYNEKKLNPGSQDPKIWKHSIFILDTGEIQDMISFAGQGHWLEIHLLCLARRSVQVQETRVFMSEYEWGDCLL